MADFNIEDHIKDLSPEMQEKARACTTPEELMELADANDIELPNDVLDKVSGGCGECGDRHAGSPISMWSTRLDSGEIGYWIDAKCARCQQIFYLFELHNYARPITEEQYRRRFCPVDNKYYG